MDVFEIAAELEIKTVTMEKIAEKIKTAGRKAVLADAVSMDVMSMS